MHVGDEVLDVGRDHPGDREPSQRVDIREAAGDHPTEAAAPYSFNFRKFPISPTIPRRNASTHTTKIAPCVTVTQAPNWAR